MKIAFIDRQFLVLAFLAICKVMFCTAVLAEVTPIRPTPKLSNPAYVQVPDDPRLPRVLLIGDSVSLGYTLALRRDLAGIANLDRPPANCGSTEIGLRDLDKWLDGGKWKVIYFNWGLHDLSYQFPDGRNINDHGEYARPNDGGRHQVHLPEYKRNLILLVRRLRETRAKLIFATTTPVSADLHAYVKGSEIPYNEVARLVMQKEGVQIDDLWKFTEPQINKLQIPGNPHFTAYGYQVIAQHVAKTIRKALQSK